MVGAPHDDVGANADQGSATIFFQAAPTPPPPPPPLPLFPAKLKIKEARVSDGVLEVLAGVTGRASGDLAVRFEAAGREIAFEQPIGEPRTGERNVRIRRALTGKQRNARTGIVEIDFAGNPRTQPDAVRIRAASGERRAASGERRAASGERTVAATAHQAGARWP